MNYAANPQDLIYHEKQEGRLCAVHALNNLLQGNYFTAVDLGNLADQLDEAERQRLAEGGSDSEDYRRFISSPSSNKDDTGYFSLQVIQRALNNLNLEMIPFNSKSSNLAMSLRKNPNAAQAFICHYRDHWFAIRKFGAQWINLNSVVSKPTPISDTYLNLYLEQLQTDGYSIYLIAGDLIQTEADSYLLENPLPEWYSKKQPPKKLHQASSDEYSDAGPSSSFRTMPPSYNSEDEDEEDEGLQKAVAESLRNLTQQEKSDIEEAILKSLKE